jgi:erythromycin esterase-like protein
MLNLILRMSHSKHFLPGCGGIRKYKGSSNGCVIAMQNKLPRQKQAGFYGLDLYRLRGSMRAVIDYLEDVDPEMAKIARRRYGCLEPWVEDLQLYCIATLRGEFETCGEKVVQALKDLLSKRLAYAARGVDGEEFHCAEQNERVVADAEAYYRSMYYRDAKPWIFARNRYVPDAQALDGTESKQIQSRGLGTNQSWAEGTASSMSANSAGGPLASLSESSACGTQAGTVAAAHNRDDDTQVMNVDPSHSDSYEYLMHETSVDNFLLDPRKGKCHDELREALMQKRLERFNGVVYPPDTERWSHIHLLSCRSRRRPFSRWKWCSRQPRWRSKRRILLGCSTKCDVLD